MESANHLVTQHAAKQNVDLSEISFIVQLADREPKLRALQGQFKGHKIDAGVIWLKDLRQLCEQPLRTSWFSHVSHEDGLQAAKRIGHWQSNSSFIGQHCCSINGFRGTKMP